MYKELINQLKTGILYYPIIIIPHYHYELIDEAISIITSTKGYPNINDICEFDISLGIIDFKTKMPDDDWSDNLEGLLKNILIGEKKKINDKRVFIIKKADDILKSAKVISLLSIFAQKYERGDYNDDYYTIILVSHKACSEIPEDIRHISKLIEISAPSSEEIKDYLTKKLQCSSTNDQEYYDNMVRTLQGLQMYDIKQTLRAALGLCNGRIKRTAIHSALNEKKCIVKKSGIIEVADATITFDEIGGLGRLISDLKIKSAIYENIGEAVKYNVPIPKGILIIGMPGCGKSMIAQATANQFGVPLLRLDISRLMGKYVGESEANLRAALVTAEAAHPCVLWIDEIEKAFAGSNTSDGDTDSLVLRMMGHFLTWMQERKHPVFIVATANDVMRPEFMRKGRFDEVYFVDFPDEEERTAILKKKIEKRYPNTEKCLFDFSKIDCGSMAKCMTGTDGSGFAGAEIECVLNMVVERKFQEYLEQKRYIKNDFKEAMKIEIKEDDFRFSINQIKPSILANQRDVTRTDTTSQKKTAIERIREMQEIYHFTNANERKR